MQVILLRAIEQGGGGPPETNVTGVYPPLGIATLAACLREKGHPQQIIDSHALNVPALLAAKIVPEDFDGLLAFSTTTLNWHRTLDLIRACRARAYRATVLVGGPHLDLYPVETASFPEVDLVCIGEGDQTLPAIATALEKGNDPLGIPGTAARRNGEVLFGPPPQITNLDQLPLPAWNLLPLEKYRAWTVLHPFGTMVSGRGCPYKCRFCSQRYAGGQF
ncbi:MAG: B12-binding domain-containing radical SAM protein, partial [Alphaproteobacteria bacterium]